MKTHEDLARIHARELLEEGMSSQRLRRAQNTRKLPLKNPHGLPTEIRDSWPHRLAGWLGAVVRRLTALGPFSG